MKEQMEIIGGRLKDRDLRSDRQLSMCRARLKTWDEAAEREARALEGREVKGKKNPGLTPNARAWRLSI